jgi:hypothetical protein
MVPRRITVTGVALTAAVVGAGLLAWYVYRKGGLGKAAAAAGAAIGGAAVQAVGGAATGAMDAVSAAIGIPGPSDTITDPKVVRWVIDNYGYGAASQWAGAPALVRAWAMSAGTGVPPAQGTAAYAAMPKARVVGVIDNTGSVGWW